MGKSSYFPRFFGLFMNQGKEKDAFASPLRWGLAFASLGKLACARQIILPRGANEGDFPSF